MTRNQLQYHANLEAARANRAREAEERVKNRETQRSNMAREEETNRSNLANEKQKRMELKETTRSNIARETETNRHNKHSEIAGYVSSAGTAMSGAGRLLGSVTGAMPATTILTDGANGASKILKIFGGK